MLRIKKYVLVEFRKLFRPKLKAVWFQTTGLLSAFVCIIVLCAARWV